MDLYGRNGTTIKIPSLNWLAMWIPFYLEGHLNRADYEKGLNNDGFFVDAATTKKFIKFLNSDADNFVDAARMKEEFDKAPHNKAIAELLRENPGMKVHMEQDAWKRFVEFAKDSGGFEIR